MKNYLKIICLIFIFSSCKNELNNQINNTKKIIKTKQTSERKEMIIHILPLGNVNATILDFIKKSIYNFYQIECIIEPKQELTTDILAASKTRYEASLILKKYNSTKNTLLITEKDIAYNNIKRKVKEWGILGLGFRPGKTCVISTFRLKRKVSDAKFRERLQKVCIHEVGHNLGLPHCTYNSFCLMNDANGTIAQVDKEKMFFCDNCKKQIGMK
jgi:archaemetzincin